MFQFTHARAHAFDLVIAGRVRRDQVDGSFHVEPGPAPYHRHVDGAVHLPEFWQAGLIEGFNFAPGSTRYRVRLSIAGAHLNDRWNSHESVESVVQHPGSVPGLVHSVPVELAEVVYQSPPALTMTYPGGARHNLVALGGRTEDGQRRVMVVDNSAVGERVIIDTNADGANALAANLLAAALEAER